jgi:hypothetical protein
MILRYQFRVIHRTMWSICHGPRAVNLFEIVVSQIPFPQNTTLSPADPQNLVLESTELFILQSGSGQRVVIVHQFTFYIVSVE